MDKPIIEIDGQTYEAAVFSGDGKLYDEMYEAGDPVRIGSMLLRPITVQETDASNVTTTKDSTL